MKITRNTLFILFSCSFFLFSQDEILRIETIDVFKEYIPGISTSTKISQQPIFTDTLTRSIYSDTEVVPYEINKKENLLVQSPSKYRLNNVNGDFNKYLLFQTGSHRLLHTTLHYNNGRSVDHNSGIYFQHYSEDMGVVSPYYKKENGELITSLQIYSNRYLKNEFLFTSSLDINRKVGLYWGQSDEVDVSEMENYIGKSIFVQSGLKSQSRKSIFQSFNMGVDYFSNNYNRDEIIFNSFLDFSSKKALKEYYFSLDLKLANVTFDDHIPSYTLSSFLNNQVATNMFYGDFDDLLIKSNLIISGNKEVDYNIGLNLQYAKFQEISDSIMYDENELKSIVFPSIHVLKNITNTQKVEFVIRKDLNYISFYDLFIDIGYVDPYFRNSVSEEMEISLIYNQAVNKKMSFNGSVNYYRINNKLIPFLFLDNSEYIPNMNQVGFYGLDFRGLHCSSSASYNGKNYNILISGALNMLNANEHKNKQLLPRVNVTTIFTVKLANNISLVSDWNYVSGRDGLRVSIYNNTPHDYVNLNAYVNANLALKYDFNNLVFSLDVKNILGQELDLFDGYSDDDLLKLRFSIFAKF